MDDIFATPETERVEIKGGWVELRKYITVGDRRVAQRAAAVKYLTTVTNRKERRAQPKNEDAEDGMSASFVVTDYSIALLERMMTAWSVEAPRTRENIERLPDSTLDELMERLNEWNTMRTEEEERPLQQPSTINSAQPEADGALPMETKAGLMSLPT